MSKNQNLPAMLFVLGIFLIAIGIGLAYFGVEVAEQPTAQLFVGSGAVLASFGIILLVVAFARMGPKRPIRWRIKKPQIEP